MLKTDLGNVGRKTYRRFCFMLLLSFFVPMLYAGPIAYTNAGVVENPDGTVRVYGYGTTDDTVEDGYLHSTTTWTQLSGPNGAPNGSQTDWGYSTVEQTLSGVEGNYTTTSWHQSHCPVYFSDQTAASVVELRAVRCTAVFYAVEFGTNRCLYTTACPQGQTATCSCSGPRPAINPCPAWYIVIRWYWRIGSGPGRCADTPFNAFGSPTQGDCT